MSDDLPILSRQVLFIPVSGREALETARVNRNGLMVLCTSVSGGKTVHTGKVNLSTWMGIFMTDSGLMIRQMDMVFINT